MYILKSNHTNDDKEVKVNGYKLALKIDNKYFSSLTGIEYKINEKIPVINYEDLKKSKKSEIFNYRFWWTDRFEILSKDGIWFTKLMQGKTAIFKDLSDAVDALNTETNDCSEYKSVILKVVLGGEIYGGTMNYHIPIYAGERIEKMKEI